ncbi:MAG: SprB repeat-containing protein, partial [Saprospiraceae bacterium]|nr:SprB repeat-containing protein [Saprospiraceae bacterium]
MVSAGETPIPQLIISDESCPGESDGSIEVDTVNNGSPPYSFILNGQDFGQNGNFIDLAPGIYTLLVTDIGSCTTQLVLDIFESDVELPDLGIDTIPIKQGKGTVGCRLDADTYSWASENNATLSCTGCRNPVALLTRPKGYENKKPYLFMYIVTTNQGGCI